MKPVKNRIFCMECQRPKMLFDSKSKAVNFIKFNADEIKDENSIAPTRAYFCKSCGGWHVTSRIRPVSEREQIKKLIGKAYKLLGEKHWPQARRFLCYAENNLRIVKERLIPSPFDDHLKSEINKAKKKLDNFVANYKEKMSACGPLPMFKYLDLNYSSMELNVDSMYDDSENGGVVYAVQPRLLTQYNKKYYYVICSCRLNEKEVQITKEMNRMDEKADSIQAIICHSLDMVEIKHAFDNCCRNQYENVADVFPGEVVDIWISGMQLRVAERAEKSGKYIYRKRSGFDYWIKLAGRNVHFYLGRPVRYTCVVSSIPLDTNTIFHLFKSKV